MRPRKKDGKLFLYKPLGWCLEQSRGSGNAVLPHQESISKPRVTMDTREYYVLIERDADGMYIGEVPQLKACYSQGETIDELMSNMREVIELCLEEQDDAVTAEFIGVQKVVV